MYLTRAVQPLSEGERQLLKVYEQVALVKAYAQQVDTAIIVAERPMRIYGTYHLDHEREEFASHATTTLSIPGNTAMHTFTLENMSFKNDVYTRVMTTSEHLRETIPHSPDWNHFPPHAIPTRFLNIAVHGPILDNLRILDEKGAYLSFKEFDPADTTFGSPQRRFTFTPSGKSAPSGSTLEALLGRIGSGTIHMWVDDTYRVRHFRFENGNYVSTTTLSYDPVVFPLTPPVSLESATLSI